MNKIYKSAITAGFVVTFLMPISVSALSSSSTTETKTTESTQTKVASTQELRIRTGTTVEDRVKADKAKLKAQLTEIEKTRIKNKCKASQNLVKAQATRAANFEQSRKKVYQGIIDRLENLAVKLDAANKTDLASKVRTEKTALSTKADAVYAGLQDYKLTLEDLAASDCVADPTAFKAVLEAARVARDNIKLKTKDFRDYYSQTTVKVLGEVKQALGTTSDTKKEGAN